jgi:hypothetical protein
LTAHARALTKGRHAYDIQGRRHEGRGIPVAHLVTTYRDVSEIIMAIAIHPYISGQPFRIKYLEAVYEYLSRFPGVLRWNGAEILDWYLKA